MEPQKVNDCLIKTEGFPLQQRALHKLAMDSWGNLLIREKKCTSLLRDIGNLISHRENVLNNLSEDLEGLPKLMKSKLINAVFCLQEGYSEAATWEKKCKSAFPFSIFSPKDAGEYQINNFIDPSGRFKELEWAKQFVNDVKQDMEGRFVLACFYGFEETIKKLWSSMKESGQLPCDGRLEQIKEEYYDDDLVVMWAYWLENKFSVLAEENDGLYEYGFYSSGLMESISKGYEYAARFFWSRNTENEKNNFLQNPEFGLLTDAAKGNHAGLVNFIYSLLEEEQKEKLIFYSIEYSIIRPFTWLAPIFCCLLQSVYYESVLSDILNPPFVVPTEIYRWILISLSFEIAAFEIPRHKNIFSELWHSLSQVKREKVLEGESYIVKNLVIVKAMDLLKIIIPSLAHSERDSMLHYINEIEGISALDDFSCDGYYDKLERYLIFFLIDYSPGTKQFNVRSDAASFFDKFIKSEDFINWISGITDLERIEVERVIERLQDSLKAPHKLLELL